MISSSFFSYVDNSAKHERRTKEEDVKMHDTLLDHVNEGWICTV